jgi:hypothetical protein
MTDDKWVSSQEAEMHLKNHCDDPRALLLNMLRAGSVTARAPSIMQQGLVVERAPFLREGGQLAARFWEAVSQEDWRAGTFGFVEPAPSELFERGESLHWATTCVEINWTEVLRQVGPLPTAIEKTRAPSVKSARPPTDDKILVMADKMKASGKNGRTIAKEMRFEPGFENVPNETVRDLIKGRYSQGRPKKAP